MSAYTMQLRTIIEQATQYEEGLNVRQKIEVGRQKLFDFNYPIFDEDYRVTLETNIIRKFYMREIGFETEGRFKFELESFMQLNMPYFNELFKSELLEYDPLTNVKMNTEYDKLNDKEQVDIRDTSQHSQTDGLTDSTSTQHSQTDGLTDTTSTQHSQTDGVTDSTSTQHSQTDGITDTTSTQDGTSTGEVIENNFSRDIISETPDSRLNLTAQDGTGIIEYANKVEEEKANNKSTSNNETHSDTVSKDKSNVISDSDATLKDKTNVITDSDASINDKTNVISDMDATKQDKSNVISNADKLDNLNSNINQSEKYIENRLGKVGIQSFSKLIQDYRQALLRVELQIHKELQQLFMLIYG